MRPIDADALLNGLDSICAEKINSHPPCTVCTLCPLSDMLDVIVEAPTIEDIPAVRCKDCVWWEKDFECWYEGSKHYHCYLLDTCTDENFFCADGREKEDAND